MIISLDEAKAHLGVTIDEDDAVITSAVEDAEEYIGNLVDCEMTPEDAPRAVKRAVKLVAATLYANREAGLVDIEARASEGPISIADLIAPYRAWVF